MTRKGVVFFTLFGSLPFRLFTSGMTTCCSKHNTWLCFCLDLNEGNSKRKINVPVSIFPSSASALFGWNQSLKGHEPNNFRNNALDMKQRGTQWKTSSHLFFHLGELDCTTSFVRSQVTIQNYELTLCNTNEFSFSKQNKRKKTKSLISSNLWNKTKKPGYPSQILSFMINLT